MYHHLISRLLFVTCFWFLLYGITAQNLVTFNPTRIATSTPTLGVATIGSTAACAKSLIYISQSTTECVSFKTATGDTIFKSCDAALQGASAISCGGRFCHVTNPVTQQIVVIDSSTNGTFYRSYGSGTVISPAAITVYEGVAPNTNFVEAFVIDASDKSLWYFKIRRNGNGPAGAVTQQKLYTSTATGAPVGVYRTGAIGGTLFLVFKGDTQLLSFTFTASAFANAQLVNPVAWSGATFTSIGAFYMDYHLRKFVYDTGCSCTKAYSPDGTLIASIPQDGANPVTFLTSSRDYLYAVDALGIIGYNEPMSLTYSVADKICSSKLGVVNITSTGGAFPIGYYIYPEFSSVQKTTWSVNSAASMKVDIFEPIYPLIIFNETKNSYYTAETAGAIQIKTVNSSVFPAYSGNYSYSLNFSYAGDVYLYCRDYGYCITPQYRTAEFMLNVGEGGQQFVIEVFYANYEVGGRVAPRHGEVFYSRLIKPGDYPLNTWTKVVIPLPKAYVTGFMIRDQAFQDASNPIYIDEFVLIPDNSVRKVMLIDFCGASFTGGDFEITNNNAFLASVATTPSTCNAAQTANGRNTTDGTATATIQNGVAPFIYNWTFAGADTTSPSVTNLTALTTYLNIYDNALNSTWIDSSDAKHSLTDTTYVHSAPYAIKMIMQAGESTAVVKFTSSIPLQSFVGSTITAWVHGGLLGGQDVMFEVTDRDNAINDEGYIGLHKLIPGCTGGIPPNKWLKATFTFKAEVQFSEISFVQIGTAVQNPLYIDDIQVSLRPAIVVADSSGCTAIVNNIAVLSPAPLSVATKAANALCYNSSSGYVSVDITGGVTPYSIQYTAKGVKNQAEIVSLLESLPESKVVIDVTDAHGCTATQVVETILQPPALTLELSNEPVKCFGGPTSIISTISGGMAPYTYAWGSTSPITLTPQPEPSPIFTDSISLLYTVSSHANISCLGTGSQSSLGYAPSHSGYCALVPTFSTANSSITFTGPSIDSTKMAGVEMWIYIAPAEALNLQISLAKADVAVSTPVTFASLSAFTATNGWNKVFFNFTKAALTDPNPTQIVITSTSPTTLGRVILDDIVLIPSFASSVGNIVYSGFNSIVNGFAGKYFLTVVDANGCSFAKEVAVTQPAQLQLRADIQTSSSNTAQDGAITVTAIGGTPPYTFRWPDLNINGANASSLLYGAYAVQVTDANGCVFGDKFVVQFEDRLTIRKYDSKLSGGLGAIVGVGTLVGVFGLTMLLIFWKSFSKLGNFFSFVITIGVLVSYIAALVLLPEPTDQLCVAYPWLLGIAFTFVYGCLFLKTWALYRVWMKAIQYKKSNLTTTSILRTVGMVLLVEVAILAAWTATDPPKVHMKKVEGHSAQAQCDTDTPMFWIIFIAVKGAWLVFGAILSVLTRNLKKEYNESAAIGYAIYAILILMAIAVPLALLLDAVPGGRLVIEVIVPVIAFTSTLIIMFFNTWKTSISGEQLKVSPMGTSQTTGYSTGSAGTRGSNNSRNSTNSANSRNSVASKKTTEVSVASRDEDGETSH